MKKSIHLKIVLVILAILTIFAARSVLAADYTDITNSFNDTTSNSANNSTGNNSLVNNSIVNNSTVNNTAGNTSVLTTNNTSNYNNTSLPKTGIEDSVPVFVLAVIFGISAIYAYKKIQDYKNI